MLMPTVLVVDDNKALAEQYAYDLQRTADYEVRLAESGAKALDILTGESIDCVILDLEMPDLDGFDVLRRMKKECITIPVIVYTGTGNYDRCVQAVRLGAFGFIDKAEPMESVIHEIGKALRTHFLEDEVAALRREVDSGNEMVGSSPAMGSLNESIARIAPIPSPVLIYGESGTGKELVAREIHRLSGRGDRNRFIALNCAAIPENLLESELFGHERGAFTGANRSHRGAFQRAAKGTLFLDEIGDLPVQAQAKLLRVLEEEEFIRVGGERPIKMSARIIAATNRDLETASDDGAFRQDLLFRLNVHVITVPPLRNRASDIPVLVDRFLETTCKRFRIRKKRISPEALRCLTVMKWEKNNVRELRNIVERSIIASRTDLIDLDDLPGDIRMDVDRKRIGLSVGAAHSFKNRRTEAERQIIVLALEENDWQISKTADALELADHASLLKIMRRLDIHRERQR